MPNASRRNFLAAVLGLAAGGCASTAPAEQKPAEKLPTFGAFRARPVSGKRVTLEIYLHESAEMAKLQCRLNPNVLNPSPSCVVMYRAEGYSRIDAVMPTGWDDHASLIKLGHEVLHTIGAEHG